MKQLRIRNWDKWQSYRRDRGQPPWIKVQRAVIRDPDWVALTDAQRGQLVVMWVLAADRDGVIPASPELIKKLCYMDTEPDLELFMDHGFIEPDATVTPSRRQHDAPEERREEAEEKKCRVPSADIKRIFEHWQEVHGHKKAKLDTKRRKLIADRLKTYELQDLLDCITGYSLSPFHRGENDNGQVYDAIEMMLRDAKQVEQGMNFKANPPKPKSEAESRVVMLDD